MIIGIGLSAVALETQTAIVDWMALLMLDGTIEAGSIVSIDEVEQ